MQSRRLDMASMKSLNYFAFKYRLCSIRCSTARKVPVFAAQSVPSIIGTTDTLTGYG
jgi:hypothetical protein